MALEIRQSVGLLAACVSIRDLQTGSIDSSLCMSVMQAVEYAIAALTGNDEKTAVVVVGEDEGVTQVELTLRERASGLAKAIEQPGLFLTLAAQDIVRDRLQNDVRFEDFGVHGYDDASRAERMFAVLHPDLPEPVQPHKKVTGNCPRLHKSFVGRHRERDELQDMILFRTLVTIIGPPGVGKSATAIHVARSFDDEYEDGVWWFSVDDRTSLDELLQAIANARGLLSLKGPLTIDRVAEGLSNKRCIIILDGCETMVSEIDAFCTGVLSQTNSLTFLLTSSKPIGLSNEHIYRLEPMSLPRDGDSGEDALISSDALSLFFERASQAGLRLALDEKSVKLASGICRQVDGLPVAIELVAASLRTSSLQKLAKELTEDLAPDYKRSFGLAGRHHSLENALQLSYALLNREQHDLLHRLAIFRSEWRLDVASQLWGDTLPEQDLQRLHRLLVDTSWIAYDPDRDTYRMLHTVRSFCWEKAGADGKRILSHFCTGMAEIASSVCAELQGASALEAETLLSRHYSDFVFAFEVALDTTALTEAASTLMKNLVQFWLRRNLLDDAERLSSSYLNSGVAGLEAGRALIMLGVVYLRRRKIDAAVEALERCLAITREAGNTLAEASVLMNLGVAMVDRAEYDKARNCYRDALDILRRGEPSRQLCQALCNVAGVEIKSAVEEGTPEEAKGARLAAAQDYLKEAEALPDPKNPVSMQAIWHGNGSLALARRDFDAAEGYLFRAVAVCVRHDLRHEAGEATEALAEINLNRGAAPTAAKLLGLSMQIRKESGKTRTESEMAHFGSLVRILHEQLDSDRADKLMRYGEKLDLAEILSPAIYNV